MRLRAPSKAIYVILKAAHRLLASIKRAQNEQGCASKSLHTCPMRLPTLSTAPKAEHGRQCRTLQSEQPSYVVVDCNWLCV